MVNIGSVIKLLLIFCSDVSYVVKKSMEPMFNALTSGVAVKRKVQEVEVVGHGGLDIMDSKTVLNKVRCIFKEPTDDKKIVQLSHHNFAPESKKKMKWAVNLYCDWRVNRMSKVNVPLQIVRTNLDDLYNVTQADLCYMLSYFIGEIKKVDSSDYSPNTLKEIIIMIQMFLYEKGVFWKLLDPQSVNFLCLRNVVDNLMKERMSQGLGVRVLSSTVSLAQKDQLF